MGFRAESGWPLPRRPPGRVPPVGSSSIVNRTEDQTVAALAAANPAEQLPPPPAGGSGNRALPSCSSVLSVRRDPFLRSNH